MRKKILLGTLIVASTSFFFVYDFVNYGINYYKKDIESILSKKINQKIEIENIHLSWEKLDFKNISIKNDKVRVNINSIELKPKVFSLNTLLNYQSIIKDVNVDSIIIAREDSTEQANYDWIKMDLIPYKGIIEGLPDIKIKKIVDYKFQIDEFQLNNFKKELSIAAKIKYLNNNFEIKGKTNLIKFVNTKKFNGNLNIVSSKFDLTSLNKLINLEDFKIISGFNNFNQTITVKDNIVNISGTNDVKNFQFKFLDKIFKVEPIKVKTIGTNNNLVFDFLTKPKINNITWAVNKVNVNSTPDNKNFKNIIVESDTLNYYGEFSQNFNQDKKSKELKINFNLIDLKFLSHLGIADVPEPFNNTILKNGVLKLLFTREKNEDFKLNYSAKAEAYLKKDNLNIVAIGELDNNKLFLEKFKINNETQSGTVKYDTHSNELNLDLGLTVNQEIFNFMKNEFHIPFNINLYKNNFALNFKADKTGDNKWNYGGNIILTNNDFSFVYKDKPFNVVNGNGEIDFTTFTLGKFNINADSLNQETYEIKDLNINGENNNNNIVANIKSEILNTNVFYDKKKDYLKVNIPKFEYDFKHNDIIKTIVRENAKDIEMLKKLEFPQKVDLSIGNLNVNDIDIGKIDLSSNKKDNYTYDVSSEIKNDTENLSMKSFLDLKNLKIDNKIELSTDDLEKFHQKYGFKKNIKNGDLRATGEFNTDLLNLDVDALIMNTKGNISFTTQSGEFNEVDTGAGFLLNLLNFQTLPNLISLELNNVFNSKFTYEKIDGKIEVNGFNLKVKNTDINSKIASVSLTGDMDCKNNTIDMKMQVYPKVTNSIVFTTVTIASAFNPLALLGTSILNKILPDTKSKMMEYNYKIHGKLNDPQITKEDNNEK